MLKAKQKENGCILREGEVPQGELDNRVVELNSDIWYVNVGLPSLLRSFQFKTN